MSIKGAMGAVALLAVMSSSLVTVDSGDVAVIYRFGAIDRTLTSGLGVHAPWPIEHHEIVDVSEVRRADPGQIRMLTGDTNLVDIELIIQYSVADPMAYQLGLADAEPTLVGVVLSVTKNIIATMTVDSLLTTGRAQLQRDTETAAQRVLDQYATGLRIDAVEVQEIRPPPAVLDAFKDVSSARGDRETFAFAAEGYASKRLPEVRGMAAERTESAKAYSAGRTAHASGDVARFASLLQAKQAAPESTRAQLWAEAIERVGRTAEVHVLRGETEIVLNK